MWRFLGLSSLFFPLLAPASAFDPSITFERNKIQAVTPKGLPVEGQNIEILSSVGCEGKVESRSSIQIPANCGYLHGLYRFIFVSKEMGYKQQILTDFSVTRGKNGSQTFLVGEPIEVDSRSTRALPQIN